MHVQRPLLPGAHRPTERKVERGEVNCILRALLLLLLLLFVPQCYGENGLDCRSSKSEKKGMGEVRGEDFNRENMLKLKDGRWRKVIDSTVLPAYKANGFAK